jgi:hypothetical protein
VRKFYLSADCQIHIGIVARTHADAGTTLMLMLMLMADGSQSS